MDETFFNVMIYVVMEIKVPDYQFLNFESFAEHYSAENYLLNITRQ